MLLFNIGLLIAIVFLLLVLSMIWPPDSPWAPWWRTNKKTAQALCRLAGITKEDVIYDLGCGDGEVLLTAAKDYGARGVGIEIDPLRYWVASVRADMAGLDGKVTIKKKSFFDEDLSQASVIVVYLVPKTLNRLLPKFKKELQKGTRIVSFRYPMHLPLKKEDKTHQLYLYTI